MLPRRNGTVQDTVHYDESNATFREDIGSKGWGWGKRLHRGGRLTEFSKTEGNLSARNAIKRDGEDNGQGHTLHVRRKHIVMGVNRSDFKYWFSH